jgi:hypothetical protein
MMSSPKTTIAGIGAVLVAVGSALVAMFDADPLTVPQWDVVIAAVLAGIGLIFAKDSKASA